MEKEGTPCEAVCPIHKKRCIVVEGPDMGEDPMFRFETLAEHRKKGLHSCMVTYGKRMMVHVFNERGAMYRGYLFDQLPEYVCLRCGGQWRPRSVEGPKTCPKCNSPYWDRERMKVSK